VRGLADGERFACRVAGTSMEPVLREGDQVTALRWRREGPVGLALGELLVVELPGAGLVVHRLLWKGRRAARTRGDGSGLMDPPVPWDDVLGRVVGASRGGAEALPGPAARRWAWLRQFVAAAAHRVRRRIEGDPPRGDDTRGDC
jgi:hypothetical protein